MSYKGRRAIGALFLLEDGMELFLKKDKIHRTHEWFLPVTLATEVSNFPDILVPKGTNGMLVRSDRSDEEVVAHVYLLKPHPEIGAEWDNILDVYVNPDMPDADITASLIYPNGRSLAPWLHDYYANIGAHMLNFIPHDLHDKMKRWSDMKEVTKNFCALGFLSESILHPCIPGPLSANQKMEIFAEVMSTGVARSWFTALPSWTWSTDRKNVNVIRAASSIDVKLWVGVSGITIKYSG